MHRYAAWWAVGLVGLLLLLVSGCITPIEQAQPGDSVSGVVVKDLTTGKCVRIAGGKYTGYKVVPCPAEVR